MSSVEDSLNMSEGAADNMTQLLTATISPNMEDTSLMSGQSAPLTLHTNTSGNASRSAGPGSADYTMMSSENRILKSKTKQLNQELMLEQETVATLRRKLNSLEKERLDSVSRANEEASRLDGEVARLRAQVEKGEAIRQDLEFELAKARRETSQEKQNSIDKELLLTEVNENMKVKVGELSQQIQRLMQELESTKSGANQNNLASQQTIDDKDRQMLTLRTELDKLAADKVKIETTIQQQEKTLSEMEEKIRELEAEGRLAAEKLRRQVMDTDLIQEKEERLKKDFEMAMQRNKSLEESVEAERAAHLESKFNSEIIQLRIRDLEGALELEKAAKTEALATLDITSKQLRELQLLYDDERKLSQENRNRMEQAEKEYALLSKQLTAELDDKKSVISKLSEQIELHQKNFCELKDELNKAKKRQIFLEETYGGSMRELEMLVDSFNTTTDTSSSTAKKKPPRKKEAKAPIPSALLESMRHLLMDYRRQLDNIASELSKLKAENQRLAQENTSYKQMMSKKEKTLETAQQSATRTSKELKKCKGESTDLEKKVNSFTTELNSTKKALEREHKQHVQLQDQMVKVATKCKTDEKTKQEFLQLLYTQLVTGQYTVTASKGRDKTWDELTTLVNEQIAILLNGLHRAEEKAKHGQSVLESKEQLMASMQKAQDDQVSKLTAMMEERSGAWQQQKAEMDEHYSQLLAEIHSRHKKTQVMADKAWEKVRATGTVQQGLETECSQLRTHLTKVEQERDTLLTTCALFAGAIYPLYARNNALTMQRHMLSEQYNKFEHLKKEVQLLVDTLSLGDPHNSQQRTPPTSRQGILRFRVAVIAVLAANRLGHTQLSECQMFVSYDPVPGSYSSVICTGGIQPEQLTQFRGVATPMLLGKRHSMQSAGEHSALSWMTSTSLLSTILTALSDLQDTIQRAQQDGVASDSRTLVNTARNSFTKLMCHLQSTFPALLTDAEAGLRDRNSLIRLLGNGLHRILSPASRDTSASQPLLHTLQQCVVSFTRRLHDAEVERRDLRAEVSQLAKERDILSSSDHTAQQLQEELNRIGRQIEQMVSRERFDGLCEELDGALRREEQSQKILHDQDAQILTLNSELDMYRNDGTQNEKTIIDAMKGLSEARNELRHQEQLVRQLNRQLKQMDSEKRSVSTNLHDAEQALRTAAKDKETLSVYLKAIEAGLEKVKLMNVTGGVYNNIDLSPITKTTPETVVQMLAGKKAGPELSATMVLVAGFVQLLQQMEVRLCTLREEVASHKTHASQLKRELTAACRRQYDEQVELKTGFLLDSPNRDTNRMEPTRLETSAKPTKQHNTFIPLIADTSNDSYKAATPTLHKSRHSNSASHSSKTPSSRAARQTVRSGTQRTKPAGSKGKD